MVYILTLSNNNPFFFLYTTTQNRLIYKKTFFFVVVAIVQYIHLKPVLLFYLAQRNVRKETLTISSPQQTRQ